MYPDVLTQVIHSRFDVKIHDEPSLRTQHKKYFGNLEFYDRVKGYFKNRFEFLSKQISKGEPVFATNLFHASIGYLLTWDEPEKSKANLIARYLLSLRSEGGFLAIMKDYVKKFPKLGFARKSPMIPEIYSSYYAYFLLKIFGLDFKSPELENMISWVVVHQKPSGVIYNAEYSDTPEPRRFETELTSQLYFATELISSVTHKLPDLDLDASLIKAKEWAFGKLSYLKTVAGRYFAIKALHRISPDELVNIGEAEMAGFLQDRISAEDDGYYDYRLQDKRDEVMTSPSVTELDKISSHVFSTYYALTILKFLERYCNSRVTIDHRSIKRLAARAANPDSGFGMKVMVKDFEQPYGPTSTELESLLILLMPLLVE